MKFDVKIHKGKPVIILSVSEDYNNTTSAYDETKLDVVYLELKENGQFERKYTTIYESDFGEAFTRTKRSVDIFWKERRRK